MAGYGESIYVCSGIWPGGNRSLPVGNMLAVLEETDTDRALRPIRNGKRESVGFFCRTGGADFVYGSRQVEVRLRWARLRRGGHDCL